MVGLRLSDTNRIESMSEKSGIVEGHLGSLHRRVEERSRRDGPSKRL